MSTLLLPLRMEPSPSLANWFFGSVIYLFVIHFFVRFFRKAGYDWWWCFLMIVPILNLVLLVHFSYANWPIEMERELLREEIRNLNGSDENEAQRRMG